MIKETLADKIRCSICGFPQSSCKCVDDDGDKYPMIEEEDNIIVEDVKKILKEFLKELKEVINNSYSDNVVVSQKELLRRINKLVLEKFGELSK